MDALSQELHEFLVQLGNDRHCVSKKMEHYMEHLVRLTDVDTERALIDYYGLFGNKQESLSSIAQKHGCDETTISANIERCLRRIAVSPEWQMIKQTLKHTK